jgi:hypothetical protein
VAVVASAGYTSVVASALTTLTSDTDALFVALEAKVDSGSATTLSGLQTTVDAAFAAAEALY